MSIKRTVPVLKVDDMHAARQFYCDMLGFQELFRNQPTEHANPAYVGYRRDTAVLDVSSFSGDGVSGVVVNLVVEDVDALFAEFKSRGVQISLPPVDQTWGVREMHLEDPSGNKLRFCQ